jgi:hypothetical protein
MFLKKVLGRTVAATATTGLLVAPLALTTSPQLMNVACSNDPTETPTTLVLQRDRAQYGTKTLATATVSSAQAGKQVTFSLTGANRSQSIAKRVAADGRAQWLLPRGLVADRTYTVQARFEECNPSAPATYRVDKATSKPAPTVVKARKAKFRTTAAPSSATAPTG